VSDTPFLLPVLLLSYGSGGYCPKVSDGPILKSRMVLALDAGVVGTLQAPSIQVPTRSWICRWMPARVRLAPRTLLCPWPRRSLICEGWWNTHREARKS